MYLSGNWNKIYSSILFMKSNVFILVFLCFGLNSGFPSLFLFCYMCDQCKPLVESIAALNTDDVRTNRLDMDGPTVKSTVSSHIATLSWNEISKSVFIKKNAKFNIFINIFTWLKGLTLQEKKSFLLYSIYWIYHTRFWHIPIFSWDTLMRSCIE